MKVLDVLVAVFIVPAMALTQPQTRPATAPVPSGVRVDRDLTYGRAHGKDLLLDLYRPDKQEGKLPVIVWIHGGAFRMGSKDDGQMGNVSWLSTRGYAVASINYRLSYEAIFPAQIQDCKAAVRWLRANADFYALDPAHIGAWGASAGGHLAAMLGTSGGVQALEGDSGNLKESSRVQAVVDFFGPTDFLKMDAAALPGGQKHDPADSPESLLVGGPIQDNKDKVARANPITYVTRDSPPFLILHGDQDPLVPLNQSELLYDALKKAGVNVTFHKIVGAGHGGPQFGTPVVRAMVQTFFDQNLKAVASANSQ
jgi:acetyl esterase/lipase